MAYLLAGDLGGTSTRLGMCDLSRGERKLVAQEVYRNSEYEGIEAVIAAFLDTHSMAVEAVCLAVAGAVDEGRVEMTNLGWTVSATMLAERFGFARVEVINDLTALAAAVPYLRDDDLLTLKEGERQEEATVGVIAPGTGLGQGYIIPLAGGGTLARGSEGGHAGFTPGDETEARLLQWLLRGYGTVSAEQLCAGPGLTILYRFYTEVEGMRATDWVEERARQEEDLAPVIVSGAAAARPCALCRTVLERYLAMVGAETANLALKLLARGGMYIGGGVLLRLLEQGISLAPLARAFVKKGKMAKLLASIPVFLITKENTNLHGALHYALDREAAPSGSAEKRS